jgi:hypothetical protein
MRTILSPETLSLKMRLIQRSPGRSLLSFHWPRFVTRLAQFAPRTWRTSFPSISESWDVPLTALEPYHLALGDALQGDAFVPRLRDGPLEDRGLRKLHVLDRSAGSEDGESEERKRAKGLHRGSPV